MLKSVIPPAVDTFNEEKLWSMFKYFDNSNNIKKTYNAKDAYSLEILKKYLIHN